MADVLTELVHLLALEKIDENLFRGQSQDLGWGTVYGGQVLGQALSAAAQTVDTARAVHSLQAYFLRLGNVSKPIVYHVDRIRDGKSFNTRKVVATQGGEAIFNLAASFQVHEPGLEHQDSMPVVASPEDTQTDQERIRNFADKLPPALRERALAERPFEMRITGGATDLEIPDKTAPVRTVWVRAVARLAEDPWLHSALLAYASDYAFLTTALLPHGVNWLGKKMQVASLDHIMWFHAPFRADEWLLHVIESPRASGARALVRGKVFTQDGRLVASTAQEGLIRNHG
jgi:acyl-CoA thioesterase II